MTENNKKTRYAGLSKKVVIVTGGASGIGAEVVKGFGDQDCAVGFIDKNQDAGLHLEESLRREGKNVKFIACDITQTDALQSAVDTINAHFGCATVLVNNAANDDRHDWSEVTPEYYEERIGVNLKHMFFAIQSVAPGMIEQGHGSIVNMGSSSWWECLGGMPVYTTSKAAVHGMTRSFARDLGSHGIRVNTVVPGWIMTDRQKSLWATPEALDARKQRQCLPDLIEPSAVVNMVMFLSSDDAKSCTASNYMVDAGSI